MRDYHNGNTNFTTILGYSLIQLVTVGLICIAFTFNLSGTEIEFVDVYSNVLTTDETCIDEVPHEVSNSSIASQNLTGSFTGVNRAIILTNSVYKTNLRADWTGEKYDVLEDGKDIEDIGELANIQSAIQEPPVLTELPDNQRGVFTSSLTNQNATKTTFSLFDFDLPSYFGEATINTVHLILKTFEPINPIPAFLMDTYRITSSRSSGTKWVNGAASIMPPFALEKYYDQFTTLVYNGTNGTTDWSTSPWVEVGDGSLDPLTGAVAVRNSTRAFGGTGNTLKTGLGHANSAPGVYVYREVDLSSATSATLSFYFTHSLTGADNISLEISSNGGSSWTVLKNYTSSDPDPSNESFNISAYLASNTRIRFYINTIGGGGDIWTDNVQVEYLTGGDGPFTINSRVNSSSDDAEENVSGGSVDLISSDLELISDSGTDQIVGMRFNNITVPPGATITNAYIEFEVDELDSGPTDLTIIGHDTINSVTFTNSGFDISKRIQTTSTVSWNSIPSWDTESEKKQTPDIKTIIQEIVNLGGWASGNSLSILIEGSGERTAEAYDGEAANAPILYITYITGDNADLIVTTANDVLDGDTTSIAALIGNKGADNHISLREAIIAANNSPNTSVPDTIRFSIGTGAQTIMVNGTSGGYPNGTGFDFIMDQVIIDATTQPGYAGTPLITLDGTNATGTSGGLILRTDSSTIKGFIVINFDDEGLEIDGSTGNGDNNIIEDNWVGIDASGNAAGNGDDGILVTETAVSNEVRNNVVSSNSGSGIVIRNTDSDNNWIYGNIIGLTSDTLNTRANVENGIHIYGSATNNLIGTNADGSNDASEGNIVAGNTTSGVRISKADGNTTILGNRIYNNGLLGIDLNLSTGVSSNDVDDVDTGPNDLLNFPVLINAVQNGSNLDVDFDLDLPAGWYRVEFFENPTGVDTSGYGEGELFIGAVLVNVTGAAGYERFSETLTGVAPTQIIGMTATVSFDVSAGSGTAFDKTSEFGPSYLGPGTFEVTTTNDVVDGNTTSISTLMGDRGLDGEISLREAIIATNNTDNINNNPDRIHFNIRDALVSGVHTITLSGSVLPGITDTVVIDGSTDSDYVIGTPVIELNGNSLSGHGIDLLSNSDGSTVRGLIINRFDGAGIQLYFSDNDTIVGNWIGTGSDGLTDQGNTDFGIEVDRSGGAQIGGSTIADRNVIAANGNEGISLYEVQSTLNVIQGNYIGVDKTGNAPLGNAGDGIVITGGANKNTIGGNRLAGEGNVISGQIGALSDGIEIDNPNADSNKVFGNFIGTNFDGTDTIGNARFGIVLYNGVQGTEIGGTGTGQGNIISGNGSEGVSIDGAGLTTTSGNSIVGNYIGTDVSGSLDLGNIGNGIEIWNSASGNTIGGTTPAHRNIISGNDGQGIEISGATTSGNVVRGNYIGTNSTGLLSIRNEGNGIRLNSSTSNIIGGTDSGAGNVISGNNNSGSSADGIYIPGGSGHIIQGNIIGLGADGTTILGNYSAGIAVNGSASNQIGGTSIGARNVISANNIGINMTNGGSSGNAILGNYIGTDTSGVLDRGNATDGIVLSAGAINDTIGGITAAHRNIISGNDNDGIWITGSSTSGHVVQGNWIGLNALGNALGNSYHGIAIQSSANNNLVGGLTNGAENIIANNSWDGITIGGATGINNALVRNEIFNNGGLGIDLNDDAVTSNDANDSDTGPNDYLNFIEFNQLLLSLGDLDYDFDADLPSGDYRIEFFNNPSGTDGSGNGEGETYIGAAQINHPGTGATNFTGTFTPVPAVSDGDSISAITIECQDGTCTSFWATSEFSANETVITCTPATSPSVNAGTDDSICPGDSTTITAIGSGGTGSLTYNWDNGLGAGASHNVSPLSTTTYNVTVTDENGCTDTDDVIITVHSLPIVSLTLSDTEECVSSTTLILSGGTPGGGSYSGTGVSGTNFDASTAGVGNHTITYTYTDGNGCVNTATDDITVYALPAVSLTLGDTEECENSTTLSLSGGSPGGGTYSGTGVSGTNFNASSAGVGVHTITYTYTDGNGCTNVATDDITVYALPVVSLILTDTDDCADNTTLVLSGGSPGGGTYSGTGVTGTNFNASSAGAGVHTITYTYTDGNNCVNTATDDITVHPIPAATAGSNSPACVGADLYLTESGGDAVNWSWVGPNSFTSTEQNPTIINASNANAGDYTVTITDSNGCNDTSSVSVVIDAPPNVVASSNTPLCAGDSLTLFETGGDGISWSWSGPNGFSSTDQNPVIAGVTTAASGFYFVLVSKASGCSAAAGINVVINALPSPSLNLNDNTACVNETTLALSGESPAGGIFSGPGVGGTNFDASVAGVGTHAITYTYTDGNGCSGYAIDSIEVLAQPTVSLTLVEDQTCANSTILTLSGGSPSGGTYSGTGVSGGNFNASAAGIGVHTITYTYTDANGCTNFATDDITVNNLPAVSLTLPDDQECVSSTTMALSGGSPGGGSFSGTGVTGTNFDASTAGAGVHTITYTYTDGNGCSNTATDNIVVFALPTVDLTLPDTEDCVLNTALALSGGSPSGGTFSGPGVSGSNFNASSVGLGVHTITYTYTDGNGCVNTDTDDITVVSPPSVALTLGNNEACETSTTLVLIGGSPTGGVFTGPGVSGTNFDASAVGPGSHTITYTYTDSNGCGNTDTDNITVYPVPSITGVTPTDPTTCGGTEGSITVNASGGTGSYSYRLNSGTWQSSNTFNGLSAGSYNVFIRNDNGFCEVAYASNSVALSDPPDPTAEINLPPSGCVDATSNFVATDAGGSATYAWNFGTGATPATATGIGPHAVSFNTSGNKNINLTVTLLGCVAGDNKNFTVFDLPNVSLTLSDIEECVNSTVLSLSGGNPSGGTYSGPGVSGTNFDASVAGVGVHTITYTYTNGNGCINQATDDITVFALPIVNLTLGTDEACVSANTLALTGGSPSGGSFSGPGVSGTNFDASTAGAGVHTITYSYTDANGCTNTNTDDITVYDLPTIDLVSSSDPTTCSGTDGSITMTLSGGTGSYEYKLNSGSWQAGNSFTGLNAGSYNVFVRNDNGFCELAYASNPVVLSDPPATIVSTAVISNYTGEDISCVGESDGFATASGSGGTAPYTYLWSNGQTGPNLNNVSAGTYTVTVTDVLGCQGTGSVALNDPPVLNATAVYTDVSCYGGSDGAIDVTAIGGVGAYTYAWSDLDPEAYWPMDSITDDISGNDHHATNIVGTTAYSTDAVDGDYSFDFDGNTGIRYSDGTFMESPITYRTVLMWIKPDAYNKKYMLYEEGGAIEGIAFALDRGDIIASIRSSFLTRTAFSMTVPNDGLWHQVGFIYNNGTLTLTVDGVMGTSTNTGFTTINPSSLPGSGGIGDSFGSNAFGNNSFNEYEGLMDNVELHNTALQPTQISDNHTDDGDRSGLPAGDYKVYVYDLNGCIDSVTLTLSQPDSLALTANITDVLCNGGNNGEIDLIIDGGTSPYLQSWSTGSTAEDITDLTFGTYIVTVTDAKGCMEVDSFLVNQPALLTASASVTSNYNGYHISCFGESDGNATVTPSGGTAPFTYLWSNGQSGPSLTNVSSGAYSVTVTDDNGCTTTANISILDPPQITVSASVTSSYGGQHISCVGATNGTATAVASNGVGSYTYSWSNGQTGANLTNVGAGTYLVTATDSNGCISTASVTLNDPPPITIVTTVTSNYNGAHVSCPGSTNGSANAAASGGIGSFTYSWSNGQTGVNLVNVGAGTYTVTATDAFGCTATKTVTLVNPTVVSANINITSNYNGYNISCIGANDGTATALGSGGVGGYTYSWSNGQTGANLVNVPAGTYKVTATDANGCTATKSVIFTNPPKLNVSTSSAPPSDCGVNDGIILVSASGGVGGYQYSLGGVTYQASNAFTELAPGTYFVYVKNGSGTCIKGPISVSVNPPETPTIDNITIINPTTGVSNDGGILISASGNGTAIEYSNNGGTSWQSSNLFNNLSVGTYDVQIRYNGFTCISSSTVNLVAGGGVVGQGSGVNYCSDELSEVNFVEVYYVPFPEDQIKTSLSTIYPNSCSGADVTDPIQTYVSIGVVEDATLIYYDHWEDGFEPNLAFPIQATTEVWGDGNPSNGIPPGYTLDILSASDIIVLYNAVTSTTRASVIDFDGGDKIGSRGNLSMTRLGWASGPGIFLAGALEVYPAALWGKNYDIPVGPNTNINDLFEYTGAVIMAKSNNTTINIDANGDNIFETTVTIGEGDSYLINSGLSSGGHITTNNPVQVHLITGDICHTYESRWFTLKPTEQWSNSYFNPVATPNNGGNSHIDFVNAPTYVHLYNPSSSSITVNWETNAGFQSGINVSAGGTAWIELPDNTGTHFYSVGNEPFYAIATIDSDANGNNARNDWGYALIPESSLSSQITLVGFAPGSNPLYPNTENSAPVWLTADYPSASGSSGSITICIDYNGDGGALLDANGVDYDASLVLNVLDNAKIYDPDGDQTGMRIWVCDGSDAIIAGAWGQDPVNVVTEGDALDLGVGLPNGIPFTATKCADLSKDYNSNGLFDECDEVIFTIEIRNSGSLPLSTGSLNIKDTLPSDLVYIENTSVSIDNAVVTSIPDNTGPASKFPFDENGYVNNAVIQPGDSIVFRFEAVIGDLPGAKFIRNLAYITNGTQELLPEVSFPAQEPTGLILSGVPIDETASCDNIPTAPIIGSDIYATNNCEDMDTIPRSLWSLQYVDSEDVIAGELGVNAFDGDPNTIWRTQWNGANPPHPHEIQIDLGATYSISGFRYLPRQSGTDGMIDEFEFYVSTDGASWETAVTSGEWTSGTSEKEEVFNLKRGRFIRLVATSEVNGNPWTSIAELQVLQCVNYASGTIDYSEISTQTNDGSATDDCYDITRTWTATDHCGQVSVYSQNITVEDTINPVLINIPADITVTTSTIPAPHILSCATVSNIALGKPATQSSVAGGNVASNAVDGDYSNASIMETNSQAQPWWQVDLQSVHPIEEIEIWNRTDCCTARLTNYYILVSDYAFATTDLATTLLDPNVSAFFQSTEAGTPSTVTIDTTARYIRVQLQGTDILNMVEVVVTPSCVSATDNCDPDVEITFSEVNVPAGCMYDITRTWIATDNCGNTDTYTQTITVTSVLQIDAVVTSDYNGEDLSCNTSSDGTADGTVTGGVAPYTINWSNGQSGISATNLSAGTYLVTVTDNNGCSAQDSVTLVAPPVINLNANITSNYNGADVSCVGSNNGSAIAFASGGIGTKTYSWSNGQNTASATGLSAGTYYVSATDDNGCIQIDSVTLQDPLLLTVTASVTSNYNGEDISCAGEADGAALATASGGTGVVTYYWSNSQSGASISGLLAGTYYVTATDANGCTAIDSVTLGDPPPINLATTGTDPTLCAASDGTIIATATGGSGNFEYRLGPSGIWQTDTLFNGLSSGSYDVYARNDNGSCVTGPSAVVLTDPVPQSCPITPAQDTLTYCTTDVLISFSVAPSADASGYTWTIPAGMTLVYGQGNDSIVVNMNNVPAGFYDICVVTNSTCGDSPPCCITFELITCPEVCGSGLDVDGDGLVDCDDPDCQTGGTSVSTVNPTDCQANDGSITLTFSGGINPFSYTWTNGVQNGSGITGLITNLPAGLYSIVVQDALCYLDTLAINLLYNETNCPTSSSVCFQEASNYAVLGLTGGTVTINSATNIFGDVGYSNNVTSIINQKAGDSGPFIGTAYVHSNVTSFAYTGANYLPSGGVIQNNPTEDARLDRANSDAVSFSNYYANVVPDVTLGVLGDDDDRTVNRVDSITVVEITSLDYNNDVLTLVGGAGLDDAFVINVLGNFDFSASTIELINVRPDRVLFNFPNASNIVLNKDATIFNGTILAPLGTVEYHNSAIFNGAIIANNINLHSAFNLFHKALDIYCPMGVCRTATTNPHIMYYRRGN